MRGSLALAALLATLLAAGCSEPPTGTVQATTSLPASGSGGPLEATVREELPIRLQKEYALQATDVVAPEVRFNVPSDNCLRLGEATLAGGKATVTWSSPAGLAMELVLFDGQEAVAVSSGASPLELDIPAGEVGVQGTPYIAWQSSQEQAAGAGAMVQGTLKVDLTYTGTLEPATEPCTIFR
jgi:hypothetical protein